jgi:hypothetical protein
MGLHGPRVWLVISYDSLCNYRVSCKYILKYVIYLKEGMIKRMETLFNGIRWFVDANYMIIGMLVIAAMIAYVETTKVGDNDE